MEKNYIINKFKQTMSSFEIESDQCPICSSNKYTILSNKDRHGLILPYGSCQKCALIQSVYKYKFKNYSKCYNHFYGPIYKNEIYRTENNENSKNNEKSFLSRKKTGETIYEYITDFIVLKPNSRILEVGCGLGSIMSCFHEKGYDVKGIDLKEEDIIFAKSKGLNVEKNTVENLKKDEKFDLIILMRSLEHIPEPLFFIKRIRSKLNENGALFISVPSLDSLFQTADIKKMNVQSQLHFAHVYFFSKSSLKNLMSICGLRNLHMNHFINSIWVKSEIKVPSFNGNKRIIFFIFFLKYFKYVLRYKNLLKIIILYIAKYGLVRMVKKICSIIINKY